MLSLVLNGVLSLGDIRDVEKLCDRIATQAFPGSALAGQTYDSRNEALIQQGRLRAQPRPAGTISPHEREELVAYLISQTWELFLRWDSTDDGRGRNTFSGFAVPQLRCRVLDWQRKKLGRGAGPGEWGVLSTEDLGDDGELERVLGSGRRDDPADRLQAFSGLQPAGKRQAGRVERERGGAAPGRAA